MPIPGSDLRGCFVFVFSLKMFGLRWSTLSEISELTKNHGEKQANNIQHRVRSSQGHIKDVSKNTQSESKKRVELTGEYTWGFYNVNQPVPLFSCFMYSLRVFSLHSHWSLFLDQAFDPASESMRKTTAKTKAPTTATTTTTTISNELRRCVMDGCVKRESLFVALFLLWINHTDVRPADWRI